MFFNDILKSIELPEDSKHVRVNSLQNPDLIPLRPERRTWNWWGFTGYWIIHKMALSSFTSASSLLSSHLTVPYVMAAIVVGNIMTTIHSILNGQPGADHHISYTLYSKAIFGTYGFYLAILIRAAIAVVWFASQGWLGGLMVNTMLGTWSYSYLTWENTLPESVPFTSKELCGFVLFNVCVIPFLIYKPEKVRFAMTASAILAFFSMVGICAYAVHNNGGSRGPLMTTATTLTGSKFSWAFLKAISQWYGSSCSGTINKPDYTRFSSGKYLPIPGSVLGIMCIGTIVPLLGVITASASRGTYGKEIWKPSDVMEKWLKEDYSSSLRAGCFFASLFLAASQLFFNAICNCWSFGMDFSGVAPKFIDMRRGAILACFLVWLIQPWTMYNTSTNFGTVMTAFSVFFSPLIAIVICDYWIVRRRRMKLTDLYSTDPNNCYYGYKGFNIPGYVSFFVAMTPGLPGLIAAANKKVVLKDKGILEYYYGNVIFGWFIAFFLYWSLSLIFKPKDAGKMDDADYYGTYSLEDCKYWGVIPQNEIPSDEISKYVNIQNINVEENIDNTSVDYSSKGSIQKCNETIEIKEIKEI